jgi:capsid protein
MAETETADVLSGYNGSLDSVVRSALVFPTNSRLEFRPQTRRKLQEKNRGLEANFAFSTRLRSKFGRCVAGKGIFVQPVTRDPEWNVLAKESFERWASNPRSYSIDGSRDLWEDQRLVAEELGAGDGEFFEQRVRVDGRPMVQPLDPFEISSPWGSLPGGLDPRQFEDGIRTDAYLRAVSYAVRELPSSISSYTLAAWREVPAADMIHIFRRRRAKQLRGLPPLYSVLDDGIDALDTLSLMKASHKLHELLAVSKTVKPQNKGKGVADQIVRALDADGKTSHLEEKFSRGAAIVELDQDEQLNLHTSSRPGGASIEGIRFYCALFALGADLPFSVAFSFIGLGGTASRADLEDAQNTFEQNQDRVVWRQSQPIYTWFLANEMAAGRLRACRDPYWWASDWHGPAKITVDYGRSADADIALVKNMLGSHERFWEARGGNARVEAQKQIDFMKWLQERCDAAGVPIERIIEPTPGAVTNVKVNQPPNPEA